MEASRSPSTTRSARTSHRRTSTDGTEQGGPLQAQRSFRGKRRLGPTQGSWIGTKGQLPLDQARRVGRADQEEGAEQVQGERITQEGFQEQELKQSTSSGGPAGSSTH